MSQRSREPAWPAAMVAHYLRMAGEAGAVARHATWNSPAVDAALRSSAEPIGSSRWLLAMRGGRIRPSKRWPRRRGIAGERSPRATPPVLLLGSPEKAACEAIAADTLGGTCTVLAGRTSLAEAIAIVSRAHGFVSNDSGLMHVAAALGVPQVAVFGSTSPLHTPPRSARARVVWLKHELGLDCMPCFERTCRLVHHRCMTAVAPERVGTALAETWRRG